MLALDQWVDGRPVAVARMMLAIALAINSLEVYGVLTRIAGGALSFPAVGALPAPTSAAAVTFLGLGVSAAVYLLIGLGARLAAGTGALLGVIALIWEQQVYSSHLLLTTLLLGFLAFARSDSRWSLKARVRGPREVPWWPQLLMLTQVTVCYLFAGLSKINPYFPTGDGLRTWMWVDLPDWMYPVLSVGTIATELLMAMLLWLPWLRIFGVALGVALHFSIVVGMAEHNLALFAFAMSAMSTYWMFLSRPTFVVRHRGRDSHSETPAVHGVED